MGSVRTLNARQRAFLEAVRYDGEEAAAGAMERFRTQKRVSYRFVIERVYASADLR